MSRQDTAAMMPPGTIKPNKTTFCRGRVEHQGCTNGLCCSAMRLNQAQKA